MVQHSLYIVIVTYNGMEWLPRALMSIPDHYSIVIVDNNSTDSTILFIKEKYPSLILLQQQKNLGFGAANNIGIKCALRGGADYVFLMNQDVYLQPNTIEDLIQVYLKNQNYGILSPIHLNGNGTTLDKNFSYCLKQNNDLFFDLLKSKQLKSIYSVPFVNAAAWLLPRKTLEAIGGFDPIFFHYGEDDNYCHRVLYHGFEIGVVAETFIYHDREKRISKAVSTIKDKLVLKERVLKFKWANLNVEIDSEVKKTKRNHINLIFKLIFKFKFKKAKYYLAELRLIKEILPEIEKSRNTNSVEGNHYL